MKILHLIDSGGLYGAEKMLLNLVHEQLKNGLEPMILSAGEPRLGEKPIEAEARRLGLPVMSWRMTPGLNLKESLKILKWARENHYQLLHSHGFKFNVLLGMFPLGVRRIPMMTTLHGYVHAKRFSKMWLYECLDRFAIFRMQGVVLVGDAMKKELPNSVSRNNHVKVIPNGLDISGLQEDSIKPLDEPFRSFFQGHSPVILGVGRLSREKGFDRLVRAFGILQRQYPKAGLVIVGEGKQRAELETKVDELGIASAVLMPGYCNKVPSLLRQADVLVMSSLTEGLPITLLEAMSLKTPVVASAVGEIPKVLEGGSGGVILEDIEPDTIASSLSKVLMNEELTSQRVDRGWQTVTEQYSAESMAGQYLQFYQEVLAQP